MIEIAILIIAIVSAIIAYRTLKRTPKLLELPRHYGSPTILGVKMPEPPGLPGYDTKRRNKGLRG